MLWKSPWFVLGLFCAMVQHSVGEVLPDLKSPRLPQEVEALMPRSPRVTGDPKNPSSTTSSGSALCDGRAVTIDGVFECKHAYVSEPIHLYIDAESTNIPEGRFAVETLNDLTRVPQLSESAGVSKFQRDYEFQPFGTVHVRFTCLSQTKLCPAKIMVSQTTRMSSSMSALLIICIVFFSFTVASVIIYLCFLTNSRARATPRYAFTPEVTPAVINVHPPPTLKTAEP